MIINEHSLNSIERLRKEHLESDMVSLIATRYDMTPATAMKLYYSSRLSKEVAAGNYGIEQLDANYLVDDLFQYEPELFTKNSSSH